MMVRPTTSFRAQLAALCAALALACGRDAAPAAPVEHVITQATLDSLPRIEVSDGRLLCLSYGRDTCPLRSAVANWLDPDRFAVWEPGRPVQVWHGNDSLPMLIGASDGPDNGPVLALAVAKRNGDIVVLEGNSDRLLHYNGSGRLTGQDLLERPSGFTVRGFVDAEPVIQRMRPIGPNGSTVVEFLRLARPTDTTGVVAFTTPLPWMKLVTGQQTLPPFFPSMPTFAMAPDGALAWSSGDHFVIHRLDRASKELWTIKGDMTGPPITPADQAARRAELREGSGLNEAQLDTMATRTGTTHPAISGLTINREGQLLAAGAETPGRDSVDFYRFAADGKPVGHFLLSKRVTVLLFSGDSLLVHRPTESDPWEIRWLHLKPVP